MFCSLSGWGMEIWAIRTCLSKDVLAWIRLFNNMGLGSKFFTRCMFKLLCSLILNRWYGSWPPIIWSQWCLHVFGVHVCVLSLSLCSSNVLVLGRGATTPMATLIYHHVERNVIFKILKVFLSQEVNLWHLTVGKLFWTILM